jgi:hypothetical protein
MGFWALFDVCLLAAGVISIVFSIVYRKQDILLNLTISKAQLLGAFLPSACHLQTSRLSCCISAALIMGIFLVVTFVFSIGAIVQKNHVTIGLVILNYILIADAIVVLCVGTFVWIWTLRQRNNYHPLYAALPPNSIAFIQDKVRS